MNEIDLVVSVDRRAAWELAQFAKRLGFQACYDLTEAHLSHEERRERAYLMIHGMDLVARALNHAGIAPR